MRMSRAGGYDPFRSGPLAVVVEDFMVHDVVRDRTFPTTFWSPSTARDSLPLVVYAHHSGGHRRVASLLCTHLASHGYAVAAMDHSEVVAAGLRGREGESAAELQARVQAIIAARIPDIRVLLDTLLTGARRLDATRIGLVGHSFGGWAVLAAPDVEPRVHAIVAHAPGGASSRRPGILPLDLDFAWGRDIPTLVLAGDADVPVPLGDVTEVYERVPSSGKRLLVLHDADHQHFVDDVAGSHEAVRNMQLPPQVAWLPQGMRPISELCSPQAARLFTHSLTLAHLDATLRDDAGALAFLDNAADLLSRQGIACRQHAPV
jgi:dienelactone hydrolase